MASKVKSCLLKVALANELGGVGLVRFGVVTSPSNSISLAIGPEVNVLRFAGADRGASTSKSSSSSGKLGGSYLWDPADEAFVAGFGFGVGFGVGVGVGKGVLANEGGGAATFGLLAKVGGELALFPLSGTTCCNKR